jgi:hypothetical protein
MNSNDYPQKVKTCGSFSIFKPNGNGQWYDNRCLVKVICPNLKNVQIISEVTRRLTNLQLDLEPPDHRTSTFAVKCRPITLKGVKRRVMEVFAILSRPPQEAIDWIEKYCTDIEISGPESAFDTSKLSVGPCAYRENGKAFVKVRFDGISIPFFLKDKTWDREATHKALVELNGPALAADFIEIMSTYQTTILDRALERPLNLSGIHEYAQHKVDYWIESPIGVFQSIEPNSPLMSVPGAKIFPVATYGYAYRERNLFDFVLFEDELYRINGYHELQDAHSYNKINGQWESLDYKVNDYNARLFTDDASPFARSKNMVFTMADVGKIDAADTFVREKLIRTLKAKL